MGIPIKLTVIGCILLLSVSLLAKENINEAQINEGKSAALTLQKRLGFIQSFQTKFEQVTRTPEGAPIQSSTGSIWIGPDASFKIETELPFAQSLVSDGDNFWSYEPDLFQVTVAKLNKDINKVPILLFGSNDLRLLDAYQITVIEISDLEIFTLRPLKTDSLFLSLKLSFQGELPISISILDSLGQETSLDFHKSLINPTIDPLAFQFSVPAGVDVIDER
jgi:outer membrane lipoprotein carrier protein